MGDLRVHGLTAIRWDGTDQRAHLADLYVWAERFASDTAGWYLRERVAKSRWSRALRALAAVFAALGGIVPLAAMTISRPELANWGFVVLGLAAGCVAYDRYFGYSTAWQRYVTAALTVRSQLAWFQLAWARAMAPLGDRRLSTAETCQFIELTSEFVSAVNSVVRDETHAWLVEFHTRLAELESKLRSTTPPSTEASSPAAVVTAG